LDLEANSDYQRAVATRHPIAASRYSEALEGQVVVVVREDGTKVVVDGLQRCTQELAARRCGMPLKETIPARVFFDLDLVEEVEQFLALNLNRRKAASSARGYDGRGGSVLTRVSPTWSVHLVPSQYRVW